MKKLLLLLYQKYLNVYHYKKYDIIPGKKNMSINRSKELSYMAVRNIIGVILFFTCLFFFILLTGNCFSGFKINLIGGNRLLLYMVMLIMVFSFLHLSKRYLRPLFKNIEPQDLNNKEIKKCNRFYIVSIILLGLFSGLFFIVARLIFIYMCM